MVPSGKTRSRCPIMPMMLPDFERDQPDQIGVSVVTRCVHTYEAMCAVDLSARAHLEALRCAAELSWFADWRLARPRAITSCLTRRGMSYPAQRVEFFRTRTDVSIMLPGVRERVECARRVST